MGNAIYFKIEGKVDLDIKGSNSITKCEVAKVKF
jgi:hypothetical protein